MASPSFYSDGHSSRVTDTSLVVLQKILGALADGSGSAAVYSGHGSPNGVQTGNVGDLYTDLDSGAIWPKISGTATKTGWGT